MRILVNDIVANCDYSKSSFCKVLTRNGINNHIELLNEDLIKLYKSERIVNKHSKSLRNHLKFLLNDVLEVEK